METAVRKLKTKLKNISTESLLGMISLNFISTSDYDGSVTNMLTTIMDIPLKAPQRQLIYLAGLLLTTDEAANPRHIDRKEFLQILTEIQKITFKYIEGFVPSQVIPIDLDKAKRNYVALEAFTSYFDTGLLLYEEQIEELIITLYSEFDQELSDITGLSINDYLEFYRLLHTALSNTMQRMTDARDIIGQDYNRKPDSGKMQAAYRQLFEAITSLNRITVEDIERKFGEEKTEKLLLLFALKREEKEFLYYNGDNPFSKKPLCWINDSTLFVVSPILVLNSIYNHIMDTIDNPTNKFHAKATISKGNIVEEQFYKTFEKIFQGKAKIYRSVCEKPGTLEHDFLIESGNYILVAEAKASKVREPFFNPEKSYPRIKDHFFSASGIGGAYEQACSLISLLQSCDDITLYQNKKIKFSLNNLHNKTMVPIVLTLNNFGGIAINTSSLIVPEENFSYPWVCSLPDFQNLFKMIRFLNKSSNDFIEYVLWRSKNHKNIYSGDELDVAEAYFTDPSVKKLSNAQFFISDGNDDLIDTIYYQEKGILSTNRRVITSAQPYIRNKPRIYPNDLCPCGSGRKFKKCHKGQGVYD